jgi:predicted MPP superfamily phosphohydrolase
VLVPGTTDGRTKRVQLFTTSGFGDWFPFRVACPRELPLLILRRG